MKLYARWELHIVRAEPTAKMEGYLTMIVKKISRNVPEYAEKSSGAMMMKRAGRSSPLSETTRYRSAETKRWNVPFVLTIDA